MHNWDWIQVSLVQCVSTIGFAKEEPMVNKDLFTQLIN